jgi:Holliday junction resolvase-like predicted endonuclease
MNRMSPRRQGDLGELSAMEWLGSQGYAVYYPIGHSPDCDLVVDDGGVLQRVQVKTTSRHNNRRWEVMLCTRGGNQSWSGTVKLFSASRCDWLFVVVADGRRWFVPADAVAGGTGVVLGGPKYAEFEVEPGRPLFSAQA